MTNEAHVIGWISRSKRSSDLKFDILDHWSGRYLGTKESLFKKNIHSVLSLPNKDTFRSVCYFYLIEVSKVTNIFDVKNFNALM